MNEIDIRIHEKVGSSAAVSSEIGRDIYDIIDNALEKDYLINLDFNDISLLTSAFLNAAIGRLYNKYSSESLQSKLRLTNISQVDLQLLKRVTDTAKQYFKQKKKMDDIINGIFEDEKD